MTYLNSELDSAYDAGRSGRGYMGQRYTSTFQYLAHNQGARDRAAAEEASRPASCTIPTPPVSVPSRVASGGFGGCGAGRPSSYSSDSGGSSEDGSAFWGVVGFIVLLALIGGAGGKQGNGFVRKSLHVRRRSRVGSVHGLAQRMVRWSQRPARIGNSGSQGCAETIGTERNIGRTCANHIRFPRLRLARHSISGILAGLPGCAVVPGAGRPSPQYQQVLLVRVERAYSPCRRAECEALGNPLEC
jgi:hypothetical protein